MGDINLEMIRVSGEEFKAIPNKEPTLPPTPLLDVDGPLSAGFAGTHDGAARAAADFTKAKDQGTVATGEGLLQIRTRFGAIDSEGAEGIKKRFPDPPPGSP